MKTILLLTTLAVGIFFGITKFSETPSNKLEITFDGQEGDYYFFTSETGQAIQLEENHNELLKDNNFTNGNYIGKKFIVELESEKTSKTNLSLAPNIKRMNAQP